MNFKDYEKFVLDYTPFEWEELDLKKTKRTKHSFLMGYIRFYKVSVYLEKFIKNNNINHPKIIDVGSYPGNMVSLSKKIFDGIPDYHSIGLDLSNKFIEKMSEYGVKCVNTEIDPNFPEPKDIKDWNVKNFDLCYLLDTLEHLVEPTYCLDQINKSLKINGYLIITTDNITNFLYIADMLRKGKGPNIHPGISSMVYRGNHRPHFKEYSKEELFFLLERSGFEVIKHEFFDRKQGDFFIDKKKQVIKKHRTKMKLKNIVHTIIKNSGYLISHLRNHHILIAKKTKNLDEILKKRKVTYSHKEFLEIRKNIIGY